MLYRTLTAALMLAAFLAPWGAAAADDERDPMVEAIGAVLHGADSTTRERGREALRADPAAAVPVLLRALEELAAATRPPVAVASVEPRVPAPAEEADESEEEAPVQRVYDVRDLADRVGSAEEVAARLRRLVEGTGTVVRRGDGVLIVRAASAGLDAVERDLDALRRGADEIVHVETRILAAPFGAPLGVAAGRARPGDVLTLDDPQETVAAWLSAGDAEVVTAPSLACLPGQEASLEMGRERSYVADFDVEVGQSSFIVDPIVATIFEGLRLELLPSVPVAGRVLVDAQVSATHVDLESHRLEVAPTGEPVEIQIPSSFRTEVRRSLDLADGGTAVLRLGDDRDGMRFAVLTVTRLPLLEDD